MAVPPSPAGEGFGFVFFGIGNFANNITKETFTTKADFKEDFILQFHNDGNELMKKLINILVTKKYRCIVKGVSQEYIYDF